MLVALEKNVFINFFKSGYIKIALERRINFPLDKFLKCDADVQYNLLEPIIPEFEEDQEIIFIEFQKSAINNFSLSFEEVVKIFNSTEQAHFLNDGKFNAIINIEKPFLNQIFERVKLNRNYKGKKFVSESLKRIFSISGDTNFEDFIYKCLYSDKLPNFIKSLLGYNTTPGILPQGNIEYFLKVGLVIFEWKDTSIDKFEKGEYYKNLLTRAGVFKNRSLYADLEIFYSLVKESPELEKAYNTIVNILSGFNSDFDLYKIAYFYLSFKFMILKADNDISNDLILYNLVELRLKEPLIFAQVINLLSRTFSFNELYEGVYKLMGIPTLKKQESCVNMIESFDSKLRGELSTTKKEKSVVLVSEIDTDNIETPMSAKNISMQEDNQSEIKDLHTPHEEIKEVLLVKIEGSNEVVIEHKDKSLDVSSEEKPQDVLTESNNFVQEETQSPISEVKDVDRKDQETLSQVAIEFSDSKVPTKSRSRRKSKK